MNKTILKTCIISAVLGGSLLSETTGVVKAEEITPKTNHTGVFKDVPKGHWAYGGDSAINRRENHFRL